jgi:hypothetical protein
MSKQKYQEHIYEHRQSELETYIVLDPHVISRVCVYFGRVDGMTVQIPRYLSWYDG